MILPKHRKKENLYNTLKFGSLKTKDGLLSSGCGLDALDPSSSTSNSNEGGTEEATSIGVFER